MKFIFSVVGLVSAWGVYKYAPDAFAALAGLNGISATLGGAATLLTAVWAINLGRLSVFEKLDDLTGSQKEVAIQKAGQLRRKIIFTMITNSLLVIAVAVSLNLMALDALKDRILPWIGYLLSVSVAYWIAGFIESWFCWNAIDESRLSLAAAQSSNKQRIKYLEKLRDDQMKTPIDRKDANMQGYTEDYKPC